MIGKHCTGDYFMLIVSILFQPYLHQHYPCITSTYTHTASSCTSTLLHRHTLAPPHSCTSTLLHLHTLAPPGLLVLGSTGKVIRPRNPNCGVATVASVTLQKLVVPLQALNIDEKELNLLKEIVLFNPGKH